MVNLQDTLTLDKAAVGAMRRTADGYLTASPRVCRADNVQLYNGSELGRPDLAEVRVYRPASEVFSDGAMRSLTHRPVTRQHPGEPVTAANWRSHAVGLTGDMAMKDGDFVRVPMLLMDGETIAAVEGGSEQELSVGYATEIIWEGGTSPKGEAYDAKMTNIRSNHVAVVDAARGGTELRIGDQIMTDKPTKAVVVDGVTVEMTDVAAQVVQRRISSLEDALKAAADKATTDATALVTARDAAVVALKAATDTRDAEIATLRKQLQDAQAASAPAALDSLVKDRASIVAKAKAVIGDKVVVDGKTTDDIRRQVVDSKLGDAAKGWTADQVTASFNTLTAGVKVDDVLATALTHSAPPAASVAALDAAYAARDKATSDAWRTPNKQAAIN